MNNTLISKRYRRPILNSFDTKIFWKLTSLMNFDSFLTNFVKKIPKDPIFIVYFILSKKIEKFPKI